MLIVCRRCNLFLLNKNCHHELLKTTALFFHESTSNSAFKQHQFVKVAENQSQKRQPSSIAVKKDEEAANKNSTREQSQQPSRQGKAYSPKSKVSDSSSHREQNHQHRPPHLTYSHFLRCVEQKIARVKQRPEYQEILQGIETMQQIKEVGMAEIMAKKAALSPPKTPENPSASPNVSIVGAGEGNTTTTAPQTTKKRPPSQDGGGFKAEGERNVPLAAAASDEISIRREERIKAVSAAAEPSPLALDLSKIPTMVSLEVISNGTTHLGPSVVIRTPFQSYLFNCPESISRFMPSSKVRFMSVRDVFVTRAHWPNIAGIAGVHLNKDPVGMKRNRAKQAGIDCTKEPVAGKVRLHGPPGVVQYLDILRSYFDADFGASALPVSMEEWTPAQVGNRPGRQFFEDDALRVYYIPILRETSEGKPAGSRSPSPQRANRVSPPPPPASAERGGGGQMDVAFLVELKPTPRTISIKKLIDLSIPPGPHIGLLKSGKSVTLADGRTITPDQVFVDAEERPERPRALILECRSEARLPSLLQNAFLRQFQQQNKGNNKKQQLNYVVHFTPPGVFKNNAYAQWMASFGPLCTHLVVNGTGPPTPHMDKVYKAQRLNRAICPEAFPDLYPLSAGWSEEAVHPDEGGFVVENVHAPTPIRRYSMRGHLRLTPDEESAYVLHPLKEELEQRIAEDTEPEKIQNAMAQFKKEYDEFFSSRCQQLQQQKDQQQPSREGEEKMDIVAGGNNFPREEWNQEPYPSLAFVGTSSALPIHYRNVSAYLLEFGPDSALLVDCGEGTLGQLRVLFGPERLARLLLGLHTICITHSHLDHMNGIFGVVIARYAAFKEAGVPYRPLTLVSNKNVFRPLAFYSSTFQDLERLITKVDISMWLPKGVPSPPQPQKNRPVNILRDDKDEPKREPQQQQQQNNPCPMVLDFLPQLSAEAQKSLLEAKAVHVRHTRMAAGFVFRCGPPCRPRKIVFSGDTMPAENLVQHGKGADLLVHECSFEDGLEDHAQAKRHSTMGQAVDVGRRMGARHLILTHFSARYVRVPPIPDYLLEAGNVSFAFDNMIVNFDTVGILPRMLPVFRELFRQELFLFVMDEMKRDLVRREQEAEEAEAKKLKKGETSWKK